MRPTERRICKLGVGICVALAASLALAQGEKAPPSAPPAPADPAAHPPTSPAPPPAAGAVNMGDPNVQKSGELTLFSGFMDPYDYDPRGRRDPFGQPSVERKLVQGNPHGPLLPLQNFDLNQLRLTGIIWDVKAPKAILKDPTGNIHVVGPNAKIGPRNGYVATIREGEIVVIETIDRDGQLYSTAQVVKIGK